MYSFVSGFFGLLKLFMYNRQIRFMIQRAYLFWNDSIKLPTVDQSQKKILNFLSYCSLRKFRFPKSEPCETFPGFHNCFHNFYLLSWSQRTFQRKFEIRFTNERYSLIFVYCTRRLESSLWNNSRWTKTFLT